MNRVPTQESQTTAVDLFLFLDIDGVLNGHQAFSNGYCGMKEYNIERLNRILQRFPNLLVVVSSAWRYAVLNENMSETGLEYIFLTHGADMRNRIHGITESDEDTMNRTGFALIEEGTKIRRDQIQKYVADNKIKFFLVLDDLDLEMPELIRTSSALGLDDHLTDKIIERFTNYEKNENQAYFRRVLAEKSQTLPTNLS